jgi:molybdopterin synthase catalytic subunit
MGVTVHIVQGPLSPQPAPWAPPRGYGALVTFEGVARPEENGNAIVALEYEAYEPMASKMIQRIGQELESVHGLLGMCVEHSTGRVDVGDCSFRLRIASAHRKEALAATDAFIDRLKQDVPIWKTAVFA